MPSSAVGPLIATFVVAVSLVISGCGADEPAMAKAKPKECQGFGGIMGDVDYYTKSAKGFVGLNPRKTLGSGFKVGENDLKAETYGDAPSTNTGRTDLCTCDCNPSEDGIGCVGYGGISFRYLSLLTHECDAWKGQMLAMDCGSALGGKCNRTNPDQTYFQFIGEDKRESPGGEAIYSVATTLKFAPIIGTFRQANEQLSCAAGKKDEVDFKAGTKTQAQSCYAKCGSEGQYATWLAYCKSGTGDGFQGFGK